MKNYKIIATNIVVILMSIFCFGCKQTEEKTAAKTVMQDGKIKVAILVYQNAELLDFAGPSEVFSNSKDFRVYTVSAISGKVSTNNNTLSISPDFTISDAPQPDILVIPGGPMEAVGVMANNKEVVIVRMGSEMVRLSNNTLIPIAKSFKKNIQTLLKA
jgi:hypothetical protein